MLINPTEKKTWNLNKTGARRKFWSSMLISGFYANIEYMFHFIQKQPPALFF